MSVGGWIKNFFTMSIGNYKAEKYHKEHARNYEVLQRERYNIIQQEIYRVFQEIQDAIKNHKLQIKIEFKEKFIYSQDRHVGEKWLFVSVTEKVGTFSSVLIYQIELMDDIVNNIAEEKRIWGTITVYPPIYFKEPRYQSWTADENTLLIEKQNELLKKIPLAYRDVFDEIPELDIHIVKEWKR